jgi:hypothetical protein
MQKHLEGDGADHSHVPTRRRVSLLRSQELHYADWPGGGRRAEFFDLLGNVTNDCLHFHFFEARLRLERPTNDFSQWLGDLGQKRLAARINSLNPYVMTLDELKHEIVKLGRRYS